jgi:heptosyltransferase-1
MRIAIVRLGAFGDIVHTLPLAADLHAAGHQVGWICEDRWSCLVEGSPAISQVHRLPRRALRSAPLAERVLIVRRLRRELVAAGYDLVIDAQGLAKSAIAACLCGASARLGHAVPRAREGAAVLNRHRAPASATHVIDQQRALGLLVPGVRPRGGWRFPLPPWHEERIWAAGWLAHQGLTGCWMLNVGAGWPTKVWPEERQRAFIESAPGRVLLLWGSPAEQAAAQRVALGTAAVIAPPTTIPQLAGLIAHAAVLVSGDTGPLHLARALGTPAVGLFGPVPAERNGVRGRGYTNLQAPGAAWERRDVSLVDMGAISAVAVVAAAVEVAR